MPGNIGSAIQVTGRIIRIIRITERILTQTLEKN